MQYDNTPRRPIGRETKCYLVDLRGLSAEEKRSVFNRFFCHEWSVRRIARADGQPESAVEDALREAVGEDRQNHAKREFVRGRLSVMPPAVMRRAA